MSDGIRRYAGLEHFLIDVQGNSLVVYLPVMEERAADRLLETIGGGFLSALRLGRGNQANA